MYELLADSSAEAYDEDLQSLLAMIEAAGSINTLDTPYLTSIQD